MPPDPNKKRKNRHQVVEWSGLGFQMLATIAIATWGGSKLDEANDSNWITPALAMLGVLLAIGLVLKKVLRK